MFSNSATHKIHWVWSIISWDSSIKQWWLFAKLINWPKWCLVLATQKHWAAEAISPWYMRKKDSTLRLGKSIRRSSNNANLSPELGIRQRCKHFSIYRNHMSPREIHVKLKCSAKTFSNCNWNIWGETTSKRWEHNAVWALQQQWAAKSRRAKTSWIHAFPKWLNYLARIIQRSFKLRRSYSRFELFSIFFYRFQKLLLMLFNAFYYYSN